MGERALNKTSGIEYINVEIKKESNSTTPKILPNSNPTLQKAVNKYRKENPAQNKIHEFKQGSSFKISNHSEDDEIAELEVSEQVAYSSNNKSKRVSEKMEQPIKNKKQKKKKKSIAKKPKTSMDKQPNLGKEVKAQEEIIESAYTELSRKLFVEQLEGKNRKDLYNMMTNELKLRSVIEKKHVNQKIQKTTDSYLFKAKIGSTDSN